MGCQSGSGPTSDPSDPPPAVEPEGSNIGRVLPGPETRVLSAMDRAHFAFRSQAGGVYRAGHSTHDVEVRSGAMRMTPIHHAGDDVITGDPLALETRTIGRGEALIPAALGAVAIDGATGELTIDRGEAVERLSNFDRGVEQSWEFANEPAGDGDLTVEVAVSGHAFAGETKTGLHFATPGRLGVRYGRATWVDAEG